MLFSTHLFLVISLGVLPSIFLSSCFTARSGIGSNKDMPKASPGEEHSSSLSIDLPKASYLQDSGSKYILPDLDSVPRELKL